MLAFYMQKGNELMLANLDVYASLLLSLIFFFFFFGKKKKLFFMPRCHNNIYFSFFPLKHVYTYILFLFILWNLFAHLYLCYTPFTINVIVIVTTSPLSSPQCCHHHLHHHSTPLSLPPLPPIISWYHTITIIKLLLSPLL